MYKQLLFEDRGVQVIYPFRPICLHAKTKAAFAEGREWEIPISDLAAFIADFASRKLANPNETQIEKTGALKRLCGFEWSRRAIARASPHEGSALVQRRRSRRSSEQPSARFGLLRRRSRQRAHANGGLCYRVPESAH